jgi:hypothetical protein
MPVLMVQRMACKQSCTRVHPHEDLEEKIKKYTKHKMTYIAKVVKQPSTKVLLLHLRRVVITTARYTCDPTAKKKGRLIKINKCIRNQNKTPCEEM